MCNEINLIIEDREFWTEKLIPLFKEENPEWETDSGLQDRIRGMMEISNKYLN